VTAYEDIVWLNVKVHVTRLMQQLKKVNKLYADLHRCFRGEALFLNSSDKVLKTWAEFLLYNVDNSFFLGLAVRSNLRKSGPVDRF
jgi:hypothetical protein